MSSRDRNVLRPLPDDGHRGYRLEIDEFLADNEMTNLFLIALGNIQKNSLQLVKNEDNKDVPNWMNFYALGGIHGEPREDWNGFTNPADNDTGYCHHGQDTFPTWHRPYISLYESAIYKEMVRVAELYPVESDRSTYRNAAARYRLPYWDIVMPRNKQKSGSSPNTVWGTPAIFAKHNVYVKLPAPTKDAKDGFDSILNPLYSFTFPTEDDWKKPEAENRKKLVFVDGGNVKKWNKVRTARVPSDRSKGETDDEYFNLAIQRQAAGCAISIWQMLNPDYMASPINPRTGRPLFPKPGEHAIDINEKKTWSAFANHDVGTQKVGEFYYPTVSVESFHDGIHVLVGTGRKDSYLPESSFRGQMGNTAYAAFDPIFYMHHNNIDRLLALYQAIWPEKYVDQTQGDAELLPFMNGDGRKCYKSNDAYVKDFWNCGFAIPGAKKPQGDLQSVKQAMKKYLSDTYFWATNNQPPTLPDWPKDLSKSWALNGPQSAVSPQRNLKMSAIALGTGSADLVHRKVALPISGVATNGHGQITIQDEPVRTSSVVEAINSINESLPAGALENLSDDSKPTYQTTWNVHVKVRKFAFDGSFSVHFFIGHVKDDQPERYMTKKNEAGFTGVFATGDAHIAGCANCVKQQAQDAMVEDIVPLTAVLYDYLDDAPNSENLIPGRNVTKKTIRDLSPEEVIPFLKENLQWRMIDLGAQLLEGQEEQAKLEVLVSSRQFLQPTEEYVMGVYGPFEAHPEITIGKPGGRGYDYSAST